MNEVHFTGHNMLNPPAIVRQAFDEATAVAECRALIERKDAAKGDFKDATLLLGQRLLDARRAMPDVPRFGTHGKLLCSPAFRAFVEKCGIAWHTARCYMNYARNPQALEQARLRNRQHHEATGGSHKATVNRARRKTLAEVQALLAEAPDLETARRVIAEELNELTA